MADQLPTETTLKASDSLEAAERRDFLKRAALVGLPVVLATVSSRTVWARSAQAGSAGASVAPSGDTSKSLNMFGSEDNAKQRRRRLSGN
jgi:hypothetical protein